MALPIGPLKGGVRCRKSMSSREKDWIDIFSALLTPTLALVGIGIAIFQLWLANTRLKHDLFERRYVVYDAIRKFIGDPLSKGNSTEETQREFKIKTNNARFLFGSEYANFVNRVWKTVIDLEETCEILEQPNSEEQRQEHIKKRTDIKILLPKMLGELESKSLPFLKLREIV